MDPSDQQRKRKRMLRHYTHTSLLSVRSFAICFTFLTLIYLLSQASHLRSSTYRPVLVVSSLSLLSSTTSRTVKHIRNLSPLLRIDGRVLFPDHVLLLVRRRDLSRDLECVYHSRVKANLVKKRVLSVDEFDGIRSIVRCPIPQANYSSYVDLGRFRVFSGNHSHVEVWDKLVYDAVLDEDSVVVFVKGLHLRPDRDSDPSWFSCHFGLGKSDNDPRFPLFTKAVTAAQEVVRCPLPKTLQESPDRARAIRVTVGVARHRLSRLIVPSVARISDSSRLGGINVVPRHDLCVCTMLWNQASAIQEWIKYHSWLGVERWFIYDNNSDDRIKEVVEELNVENYNVSRHVWPWIKTQEAGFSHCALRAKRECRWVALMDVDEYFYLPYTSPGHDQFRTLGHASPLALRALVMNISSSFSSIAEIRTSCHSFGPSGLTSPPPHGVTVGYTCRLQSPERHKSIIRPDALADTLLNVVHHFRLRPGFDYLNLPQSVAIINHYKYQVWEVFQAKFHRRVATYVVDWQENQNEGSRDRAPGLGTEAIEPHDWAARFCEVWDTGLRDFVLANMADALSGLLPWEMSINSVL